MRVIYLIALGVALSGEALGQSQNIAKTGTGNPFDSLEAIQTEMSKYSDGPLGRVVKGVSGLAGVAAALSAASDAINFRVRADGSVVSGGGGSESSSGSIGTSTVISSSSSAN